MTMNLWRRDPGPCPICGAAHTACTDNAGGEIAIVQLPLRDAAARAALAPAVADEASAATTTSEEFNTGSYRGGLLGKKRRAVDSTPPR
jgi:hypothetical protein